ncbi:MAG: ribbon-helix-helix domain-containing protein [Verrucomicrobiota bacterium]|jgi:metal-responsive CopG/Arc/MetJ family transcriptional regulator
MADSEKSIPLAISLPEALIAELDRLAADLKESRSSLMRRAIREGLKAVKMGGNADTIVLDSAFSAEVDQLSGEIEMRRDKILLEAIRTGLQAFGSRKLSEKLSLAEVQDPKKKALLLQAIEDSYKRHDDPMVVEHRRLIAERGNATTRLMDILAHVPEAKRRHDLLDRLAQLRDIPGSGCGPTWGSGLSTEAIEYQVTMSEKYGAHPAQWPEEIKRTHREWDARMQEKYGFDHGKWPRGEVKSHFAALEATVKGIPAKIKK